MESIDRNVLIQLALDLDLPDLLALCSSSKRTNQILCDNDNFWRLKLSRDYPYTQGKFINADKEEKYFQNIYRKTKNAVIFKKDFDEFMKQNDVDWQKVKYLDVNIEFSNRGELFVNFLFSDKKGKVKLAFYNHFKNFMKMAQKFQKYIEKTRGKKIEFKYSPRGNRDEYYYNYSFPKKVLGSQILDLFEPLLLQTFKEMGIKMVFLKNEKYKKIKNDIKIPVNFIR
jgi:hypothetical protein